MTGAHLGHSHLLRPWTGSKLVTAAHPRACRQLLHPLPQLIPSCPGPSRGSWRVFWKDSADHRRN